MDSVRNWLVREKTVIQRNCVIVYTGCKIDRQDFILVDISWIVC
jgi:hypothetical protein